VDQLIEQAERHKIDLNGALLLDEGGDVFQKVDYSGTGTMVPTPLDPPPPKDCFACQRRLVRCCFFVAK